MNKHFKTRLSRRNLIKTLGAAIGSGSVISSPLLAATKKKAGKNNQNPWIYNFTIGDVEAWSISDGFLDFSQGLNLMYPESERDEMKKALEQRFEPTNSLQMYINILVLPGHAMYRIASAGETLLNFTDVAHSDILMFRNPAWVIGWDHDMGQAVETRRRVFKQAAQQRTPCFGFHVPWPGLGGIVPRGSKESYEWAPRRIFWG